MKYGVDVVLAGHEHFYERLKPQKGIHYFISGGAGKLRKGDVGGEFTEKAFDTGFHFMIFELVDDQLHFQVISDLGKTVDSGIIRRRQVDTQAAPSVPAAPSAKPVPPQDKAPTTRHRASSLRGGLRGRQQLRLCDLFFSSDKNVVGHRGAGSLGRSQSVGDRR